MNKAYEIIRKEFDSRMTASVASYIIDKGYSNVREITDEQIDELEGNGLMTKEFVQALVRTARKVAKECSVFDIMALIQEETMSSPKAKRLEIWREDIPLGIWTDICEMLDIDEDAGKVEGLFVLD